MEVEFVKMEGRGNDFIIMDDRDGRIQACQDYSDLARKLCSRHFGIGGDGIILVVESKDHDIGFVIINSDGSEPQMCGNGMRCFAKYLFEKKIVNQTVFKVETKAGTIIPQIITDSQGRVAQVRVDMGEPILSCRDIPFTSSNETSTVESIKVEGKDIDIIPVSMGNPHGIIFVDNIKDVKVEQTGPMVETHDRFPEKTNVEFVEVVNETELNMRVWERGAGITLACGTGACATLVAAVLSGKSSRKAVVHLDGGDLEIEWDSASNHIYKTGPATEVFNGRIRI